MNDEVKNHQSGKTLELQCRGNLSLCKLNLEQYDQCIDQCEKILEAEPQNAKANYRMAQAVFKNNEKEQDLN